jgi:hypothetical protein
VATLSQYNWSNISDHDFESVCRDVLAVTLGTVVEQFAAGRDGGRDLRATVDRDLVIGQAKHYMRSGYPKLLTSLENTELPKLEKMQPEPGRYLVFTTVPLTPDRKTEIRNLLAPFVKSDSDVWGIEDIEGVIVANPTIEESHFKLWLTSVRMLERARATQTDARSILRLDELLEKARLFVPHEKMDEARSILNSEHCLIISGAPGIGKTTLAEMLSLGFAEAGHKSYFVTSVNEIEELLVRKEEQVIVYDDFLGRTNFREAPEVHSQERLFSLMKSMRKRADQFFILTTREYIYQEARFSSERISQNQAEVFRCILDVGGYGTLDKAAILYNHLFWTEGLQLEDIQEFVASRGYLSVIRHPNFNPRWIADTVEYLAQGNRSSFPRVAP